MAKVIVCYGAVGTVINPGPDPTGQYLSLYDPEAHDGRGACGWSPDINKAITFPLARDALALIMTVPVSRPHRADGAANRPLRAYNLSIQDMPHDGIERHIPASPGEP